MNRVTGFFRLYFAENRHPEEREIADYVENLVAHEFVRETQRIFVEHPVGRQDNRVVERAAERQISFAEHFDFLRKSERASRCDFAPERAVLQFEMKRLAFDKRVRKIDHAVDFKNV